MALRLGRSGVHTRTWESGLLADLGELTRCEPPPFNVSLGYLPGPQVPAIEPFSLEHVATAIAAPARRGRAAGNAAVPALNMSGSLARSAPATAVTLPVPRAGDALPGAAGAAATVPENEAKKHSAALRRAELESERG